MQTRKRLIVQTKKTKTGLISKGVYEKVARDVKEEKLSKYVGKKFTVVRKSI